MAFKPHYGPGEHSLLAGDYMSSPYRMFRAGLMSDGVSMALYAARVALVNEGQYNFAMALQRFTAICMRHWEFKANIADRFTRPGAVFN